MKLRQKVLKREQQVLCRSKPPNLLIWARSGTHIRMKEEKSPQNCPLTSTHVTEIHNDNKKLVYSKSKVLLFEPRTLGLFSKLYKWARPSPMKDIIDTQTMEYNKRVYSTYSDTVTLGLWDNSNCSCAQWLLQRHLQMVTVHWAWY